MASLRLARALNSGRKILKTLNPHRRSPLPILSQYIEPDGGSKTTGRDFAVPTILAGLFGFGLSNVACADDNSSYEAAAADTNMPPLGDSAKTTDSYPVSSLLDLEELARKEKLRLEELLRSKNVRYGSYPRFTVAVKGQKLTIKFKVPPSCEIPFLMTALVSRLGVKSDGYVVVSDKMLRAWDSGVAWQLTLSRPRTQKAKETVSNGGDVCILMFRPLISSDNAEIEFMEGSFTSDELRCSNRFAISRTAKKCRTKASGRWFADPSS